MVRKLLLVACIAVLVGGGYTWWMFNKPHEDVRKMKADAEYSAEELEGIFSQDPAAAHSGLEGKVVLLDGKATGIDAQQDQTLVTFDNGGSYLIQAYLPAAGNDLSRLAEGGKVRLKCRYSGYVINDETFMIPADIKLEQCYIVP